MLIRCSHGSTAPIGVHRVRSITDEHRDDAIRDIDILPRDMPFFVRFGSELRTVVEEVSDRPLRSRVRDFPNPLAESVVCVLGDEPIFVEYLAESSESVVLESPFAYVRRTTRGVIQIRILAAVRIGSGEDAVACLINAHENVLTASTCNADVVGRVEHELFFILVMSRGRPI